MISEWSFKANTVLILWLLLMHLRPIIWSCFSSHLNSQRLCFLPQLLWRQSWHNAGFPQLSALLFHLYVIHAVIIQKTQCVWSELYWWFTAVSVSSIMSGLEDMNHFVLCLHAGDSYVFSLYMYMYAFTEDGVFQVVIRGYLAGPRSLLEWIGPGAKGPGQCPPRETGRCNLDHVIAVWLSFNILSFNNRCRE